MPSKRKSFWKRFDFVLFFTVILLNIYGFIMIGNATGEHYMDYIRVQAISFGLGLIILFILTFINYDIFGKLYLVIYVVSCLMLISVFFFGTGQDEWGASRWIRIGSIGFQPAEFVKIGLILSVAKYIDKNKEKINELFTLIKILVFAFIPIVLVYKQPDLGSSLILIASLISMLFIAGIDFKYIAFSAIAGIISLPVAWIALKPYQKDRIYTFLNPELDPTGKGYQVIQSRIAIGSGQIFGRGLNFEGQSRLGFIPEQHTDFIFAVIGEKLGLIGGLVLLVLFFILLSRLIKISRNAKDLFGSLIAIGITGMFAFHIVQNIGMTISIMPVTGKPLPFISYGGTFLMANMISIGLALGVAMKKDKLNF